MEYIMVGAMSGMTGLCVGYHLAWRAGLDALRNEREFHAKTTETLRMQESRIRSFGLALGKVGAKSCS